MLYKMESGLVVQIFEVFYLFFQDLLRTCCAPGIMLGGGVKEMFYDSYPVVLKVAVETQGANKTPFY